MQRVPISNSMLFLDTAPGLAGPGWSEHWQVGEDDDAVLVLK